ncbi:hypothetical protein E2C01_089926 [Portunus trituberculatus]|uniref:Uncharacterized protein n=1 Tax=Portunus trituberculatus TaxID=210409 RepID=A0A5B7JK34_PORTR|nr:hypothetical protein [Portunus trituberculatus]
MESVQSSAPSLCVMENRSSLVYVKTPEVSTCQSRRLIQEICRGRGVGRGRQR